MIEGRVLGVWLLAVSAVASGCGSDPETSCSGGICVCTGDGCACNATSCDQQCGDVESCAANCMGGGRCEVDCEESHGCGVTCRDSTPCNVDCSSTDDCGVTCTGTSTCTVDCGSAARCALSCDATATCSCRGSGCVLACSGGAPMTCGDGTQSCSGC